MNEERDPLLEALFEQAEEALADREFAATVMSRLEQRGRNVFLGRLAILALIVALELLLAAPLQTAVGAFTRALNTSLIELDNQWLAMIAAPLNSVAGVVGVLLLFVHFLYRRMVR